MKQCTLKGEFHVSGKGLHTGLQIDATFSPAPENTGYVFKRIDLEGEPTLQAVAENVVETTRGNAKNDKAAAKHGKRTYRERTRNARCRIDELHHEP